ncbi:MAG: hypothetical protein Q7S76_03865 [bacterium]|nr:hypothetical protein [bacterium]
MKKSKLPRKSTSLWQREVDVYAIVAVLAVALFTGMVGYMFGQAYTWLSSY